MMTTPVIETVTPVDDIGSLVHRLDRKDQNT